MKMLRMSSGVTLKEFKSKTLHIEEPIVKKLEERQMRWFGHVMRRDEDHVVKQMMNKNIPQQKRRGRPQKPG